MKRLFALVLILSLMLFGCAQGDAPKQDPGQPGDALPTPTQPEQTVTDPTQKPTDPTPKPADPTPKTAVTTQEKAAEFTDFFSWGMDSEEENLVWWDVEVQNVQCICVFPEGDIWYTDETVVDSLEKLLPGQVLNLEMMIPEGAPSHAIRYEYQGQTYCYALGYNGKDGGIAFVQIEPQLRTQVSATVYVVADRDGQAVADPVEVTVESSSAWHLWAAIKEHNSVIPANAYLNRFTVEGDTGYLDLDPGIYAANVGASFEAVMLEAIAMSFKDSYGVSQLYITVDGEVYEGGHVILDFPL